MTNKQESKIGEKKVSLSLTSRARQQGNRKAIEAFFQGTVLRDGYLPFKCSVLLPVKSKVFFAFTATHSVNGEIHRTIPLTVFTIDYDVKFSLGLDVKILKF